VEESPLLAGDTVGPFSLQDGMDTTDPTLLRSKSPWCDGCASGITVPLALDMAATQS
jgi:hypothetical protein